MLYLHYYIARSHTLNTTRSNSFILPLPSDRKTDEGRKATCLVKGCVLNGAVLVNTINSYFGMNKMGGSSG